jgi:hypothetical protein
MGYDLNRARNLSPSNCCDLKTEYSGRLTMEKLEEEVQFPLALIE